MGWFRTTSKVLVWLLATSVPVQGLPDTMCDCAPGTKATANTLGTDSQHVGCCCRQEPPVAEPSCCQSSDSDSAQTACRCGATCQCKKDEPAPCPKQLPSRQRTQSNDLTVGPLVSFSLDRGVDEPLGMGFRNAPSPSGASRCIVLCRFHL